MGEVGEDPQELKMSTVIQMTTDEALMVTMAMSETLTQAGAGIISRAVVKARLWLRRVGAEICRVAAESWCSTRRNRG